MDHRLIPNKNFNKLWVAPIGIFIFFLLSSIIFYIYLDSRSSKAQEVYLQAEENLMTGEFTAAEQLFEQAIDLKSNFSEAQTSLLFAREAQKIQTSLTDAQTLLQEDDYQEALAILNEAENELQHYYGPAVNDLISTIIHQRNVVKMEQLTELLENDPSIDDLKLLLWEADAIDDENAEVIAQNIRSQIIDYTFSKASEQLNEKHFNDALIIVKDGLKYAPDSEQLKSLETTINNEQTAFETAQEERLEQAMNTALEERERNESDAVNLIEITVDNDEQGNIIVKGEVESAATVPINSIIIEYVILNQNETEIASNEVFVYPDRLYPEENGNFSFTHFDMSESSRNLQIEVNKITWYTD